MLLWFFDFASFLFSSGDASDYEVNLWHDGEVHLPLCARWSSIWTRGQVLPGSWWTQIKPTHMPRTTTWFQIVIPSKILFSDGSFLTASLFSSLLFLQKMDKNRDGVVTIEEFIETCQKVKHSFITTRHKQTQTDAALSKPKSQGRIDTN